VLDDGCKKERIKTHFFSQKGKTIALAKKHVAAITD